MLALHYSAHRCLLKGNKPASAYLVMLERRTPSLAGKIHAWLQAEAKRIAKIIIKADLGVMLRKARKQTVDDLDLSGWDALAGIITADTYDTYRQAYDDGITVIGATDLASTAQVDERALAWSAQHSAELAGKITESTRDMLRNTIQQSIDDGDSTEGLSQRIMDSQAFSDTRATTIARTELANAHISGNLDGWGDAGVEGKRSVLGSEHDIDDVCNDAADDGIIAMDEEFSNGFRGPPYHPNCVCDLLPMMKLPAKKVDLSTLMLKGDIPGHEFHGNQWTDVGGSGKLSSSDKSRLAALRVPPAWTNVRLNKDPTAALQVIGKDSKGRSQYLYSAEHSSQAAAEKFSRLNDFHNAEPAITSKAFSDMDNKSLTYGQRDTAASLALISQTGFRIGSDADTGADVKAYGASNLLGSQVKVDGNKLAFNFTGKKGVAQDHTITNPELAKYIKERANAAGDGRLFNTTPVAVRDYMHKGGGADFNVKDYRTLVATTEALKAVNDMATPTTKTGYRNSRNTVGDIVARKLGNTRGMALNSYIHPAVFSGWGFQ